MFVLAWIRTRAAAGLVLGMALVLTVAASRANAEVIQGGCTGSAAFQKAGVTVTEKQPVTEPVTILPEDTVEYAGSTNQPKTDKPVPFAGGITVALPVSNWTVVTWGGETKETSASGEYSYSVPAFVPRGTGPVQVTGTHTQNGQTCIVVVSLAIEGSPGPVGLGAATGTVVFGIGTLAAGIKKRGVA